MRRCMILMIHVMDVALCRPERPVHVFYHVFKSQHDSAVASRIVNEQLMWLQQTPLWKAVDALHFATIGDASIKLNVSSTCDALHDRGRRQRCMHSLGPLAQRDRHGRNNTRLLAQILPGTSRAACGLRAHQGLVPQSRKKCTDAPVFVAQLGVRRVPRWCKQWDMQRLLCSFRCRATTTRPREHVACKVRLCFSARTTSQLWKAPGQEFKRC